MLFNQLSDKGFTTEKKADGLYVTLDLPTFGPNDASGPLAQRTFRLVKDVDGSSHWEVRPTGKDWTPVSKFDASKTENFTQEMALNVIAQQLSVERADRLTEENLTNLREFLGRLNFTSGGMHIHLCGDGVISAVVSDETLTVNESGQPVAAPGPQRKARFDYNTQNGTVLWCDGNIDRPSEPLPADLKGSTGLGQHINHTLENLQRWEKEKREAIEDAR